MILKKKFCDNLMEIKVEPFVDQIEEIDVSKVKREYSDDDEDWDMEIEVVQREPKKQEKKKDEYIIFCEKCHRIFEDKTTLRKHKKKCEGKGDEDDKETSDEDDGEVANWDMQSVRDDNDEEEEEVEEDEVVEEEDDEEEEEEEQDSEEEEEEKNETHFDQTSIQVGLLKNENKFQCEKCKRTFKNKSARGKHRTKCIKPGDTVDGLKSYDCEVCKKVFQAFHTLKYHQKEAHNCEPTEKNVEQYKLERIEIKSNNLLSSCEICFKTFASQASLSRHKKTKHDTGKFICDVCNADFYTQHQLNKHKMIHTTERNFPCDACTKAFKTPEHLKKHQKTHMSLEDRNNSEKVKKYLCICCGKILYTYTGYQNHLKIHTGEKDFNCEICGKRFREKAHLKKHMESVHVPDRPFQCNHCELNFKEKIQLKAHKKTHVIEAKFFCEICGVSMKHKESLKHHVRNIHMGIRDYKCDLCDEGFYTSNWLKKHKANKH